MAGSRVVGQSPRAQRSLPCDILLTMRRVRAIVTGRVQGVAFRAFTVDEARDRGLTGWVRNRADGSVELEAQGDDAHVAALLAWCAHGPPAARVSDVAVEELAMIAGEHGFVQRR
jgi:acylphosphatase